MLFDITATKDWANCTARANVVLDGKPLLEDVPATYVLFLEKQLSDLHTFVGKMSELDPGSDWSVDPISDGTSEDTASAAWMSLSCGSIAHRAYLRGGPRPNAEGWSRTGSPLPLGPRDGGAAFDVGGATTDA